MLENFKYIDLLCFVPVKHLWMDNVMDPYVIFEVTPPSGEDVSEKKSICAGTTEYPIWEQTITFQIDASDRGQLLMVLCDSSLLYRNMMSKTETIDISTLKIGDKYQRRKFPISVSHNSDVYVHSSCSIQV